MEGAVPAGTWTSSTRPASQGQGQTLPEAHLLSETSPDLDGAAVRPPPGPELVAPLVILPH